MSSGHAHSTDLPEKEAKAILDRAFCNNHFWRRLKDETFRVNRDFDIPYLAGYSKSGKIVFIDRDLPLSLPIAGKRLNILPFLITHERTEKALMDFLGMLYHEAHPVATYAEHKELKKVTGVSPGPYERALDPYIKADEHKKILKVPADLDLRPYRDSRDLKLLARMQDKMVNER